jgi:hypothetical protein
VSFINVLMHILHRDRNPNGYCLGQRECAPAHAGEVLDLSAKIIVKADRKRTRVASTDVNSPYPSQRSHALMNRSHATDADRRR